jgi:mono/diheme cytochrome c family protein
LQHKTIIGLALTLVIVIFIAIYWVMEPVRQEAARERQMAEAAERGAELYTSVCAICHGPAGEGKIGPALKGPVHDEEELEKIIARGIPGAGMPAWSVEEGGQLKKHQIEDLVLFIMHWDSSLLPAPTPTATPTPTPTPSAIAAGELYAGKCAACHGANREGVSGVGPALTPESLAALSDTDIRDTILNGRSGTAMAPFKDTLSAEEIDALLQLLKYTSP